MPLTQWIVLNNLEINTPTVLSYEIAGIINIDGEFDYDSTPIIEYQEGDIKYYLSGGIGNKIPSRSLGGLPSNQEILDIVDNLFGKVKKEELSSGSELYRCMYIVNTGDSTIRNIKVWLTQNEILSSLSIGIIRNIEIQKIIIGGATEGTFSLQYITNINGVPTAQETQQITFIEDEIILADNIQTALNNLTYLQDVTVESSFVDNQWQSIVTFEGIHAYRYHTVLQFVSNNLIGDNIVTEISIDTDGSPVNTVATNVGFENQSPADVDFSTDSETPLEIGNLFPLDGFAIWFKRRTSANLGLVSNIDLATLKLNAVVDKL